MMFTYYDDFYSTSTLDDPATSTGVMDDPWTTSTDDLYSTSTATTDDIYTTTTDDLYTTSTDDASTAVTDDASTAVTDDLYTTTTDDLYTTTDDAFSYRRKALRGDHDDARPRRLQTSTDADSKDAPIAYYDSREAYTGMAPTYCKSIAGNNTICNLKIGKSYFYPMLMHYCGEKACQCE